MEMGERIQTSPNWNSLRAHFSGGKFHSFTPQKFIESQLESIFNSLRNKAKEQSG